VAARRRPGVIALDLPNEFGVPNHDPDGTGKLETTTR
jgi:hypothetical protein